jgi:hypothetical protein
MRACSSEKVRQRSVQKSSSRAVDIRPERLLQAAEVYGCGQIVPPQPP